MKHGTPAGHGAGCRELCCRRAKLRYDKQRKADAFAGKPRTVPLLGTARRIHALQALGYSLPQIARAAGLTASTLHNPTFRGATVYATTAAAVDRAYRTLSMTVPTGGYAERSRRAAAAKGWAPPLAWDDIDDPLEVPKGTGQKDRNEVDEAVVLRILGGEVMAANPAERAEVCRQWAASGRPLSDLERRTGWKAVRYYQVEAS